MGTKDLEQGSWEQNARFILEGIGRLESAIRDQTDRISLLETEVKALSIHTEALNKSHEVSNRRSDELEKEIRSLQTFRTQAVGAFGTIQFLIVIFVAFKEKIFGK